jgi:plasmid stabilization system protein ParE
VLRFAEEAEADIEAAARWYSENGGEVALRFRAAVRAELSRIEAAPSRYPMVYQDVRRAVLHKFPYSLYFVVHADGITITACTHHRRHPRRWQSRM